MLAHWKKLAWFSAVTEKCVEEAQEYMKVSCTRHGQILVQCRSSDVDSEVSIEASRWADLSLKFSTEIKMRAQRYFLWS